MDPFERSYFDSQFYMRWMADQMWTFVPAQQILGKFLATFKEFPQRQPIGSLSVDKVMKKMESGSPVAQ
jgi:arylsulfatase